MKVLISLLLINAFVIATSGKTDTLILKPDNRELFVKEGGTKDLHCFANVSSSNVSLQWDFPPGAMVDRFKKTSIVNSMTHYHSHLLVKDFSAAAVGEYKCKTTLSGSGTKTLSSAIELRLVTEDKTTANFTYKDPSATLSCLPDLGKDRKIQDVTWYKNNTEVTDLKEKDQFTIVKEKDNYTLIISKPTREFADRYVAKFTATNMESPYDCLVDYTASPFVIPFEKSKNLIQEDDMELQCKVLGYPRVPVTWYKDNKVLNLTGGHNRIKLSTLGGFPNAHLLINDVDFDDAGDYACEAHSDLFNTTSKETITVRVKDKLAALWPFLGIVAEVSILCALIFIYEKRRNKRAEQRDTTAQETDGSTNNKKEGLRYRNTPSNNPTA